MSSIRLRTDQVERLKSHHPYGARIIKLAIERWKNGDFVIQMETKKQNDKIVLQIFPIRQRPDGVSDAQIRDILDAHFATPQLKMLRELAILDRQIDEGMRAFAGVEFIKIEAL